MAFFKLKRTEADKAQRRMLKELERVAKAQRQHAAKEHKAQQQRLKQQHKEAQRQEQQARRSHREAVRKAKKASKTRIRLARKAEKERARRHRRQAKRAAAAPGAVAAPPFTKSSGCSICGKTFGQALHRRRHHCRQCRESCCLQCTSRTRHAVPLYGLAKPQKVCVVCETLVFNNEDGGAAAASAQPREPAEAVVALAASGRGRARRAQSSRRPHSAPLPRTEGVTVAVPTTARRSTKSKGPSLWTLPIRPLLKRKKSAERLRNRKMDLDLQSEKRALFGGRAIELLPQAVAPPAP